jgi:hypothetical protein
VSESITNVEAAVAALGALPMPMGKRTQADPVAAGRSLDLLALMDERAASKVSPILAAVLDEAERLRARIAELEAERHSTNEALDDAVQELRDRRECAFKNPHEPHTNEPGRPDEWQCPGVQRTAELGGAS